MDDLVSSISSSEIKKNIKMSVYKKEETEKDKNENDTKNKYITLDANTVRLQNTTPPKKRRAIGDIIDKRGLRHFSGIVCTKVKEKNVTSYNEVAEELISECFKDSPSLGNNMKYEEKNIRRRVYDALNVLMAIDVISKKKKEIRWNGLPSDIIYEKQRIQESIEREKRKMEDRKNKFIRLVQQKHALTELCQRNREEISEKILSSNNERIEEHIELPFLVVISQKESEIQCEISGDNEDVFLNFDRPFEILDDNQILRKIGIGDKEFNETSVTNSQMIPDHMKDILHYKVNEENLNKKSYKRSLATELEESVNIEI